MPPRQGEVKGGEHLIDFRGLWATMVIAATLVLGGAGLVAAPLLALRQAHSGPDRAALGGARAGSMGGAGLAGAAAAEIAPMSQ